VYKRCWFQSIYYSSVQKFTRGQVIVIVHICVKAIGRRRTLSQSTWTEADAIP